MLRSLLVTALAATAALSSCVTAGEARLHAPSPLASVDTRLGAGGIGFQAGGIPPGAQVPWGAMRLSPDTSLGSLWLPFEHFGGYSSLDTHVRCFSHTHLVGAGLGDWGNFGVMAFAQPMSSVSDLTEPAWYRSAFDRATETAQPGLYAVSLTDAMVEAQMTAIGTMSGVHRYFFAARTPAAPQRIIVLDACTSVASDKDHCSAAEVTLSIQADGSAIFTAHIALRGGLTRRSPAGSVDVYFHALILPDLGSFAPAQSWGLWSNGVLQPNATQGNTTLESAPGGQGNLGAYVDFGSDTQNSVGINVYAGISFISPELAAANLAEQTALIPTVSPTGWPSFDEALQAAQKTWEQTLSTVQVQVEVDDEQGDAVERPIEPSKPESESSPATAPAAATDALFDFVIFALSDSSCSQGGIGGTTVQSDTCALTPSVIQPTFNSFSIQSVDLSLGNYSLSLYFESPVCDDFVGWFSNGTFGEDKAACIGTHYFNYQVRVQTGSNTAAAAAAVGATKGEPKAQAQPQQKQQPQKPRASPMSQSTSDDVLRFYSLLYHSFLSPTSYIESGNVYLGFDGQVHEWTYTHEDGSPSHYVSDLSLWDTHRSQNPLLALIAPNMAVDVARSLQTMYDQGGDIPRWPLANVYTGCMSGGHGLVSLADWTAKGLLQADGFTSAEMDALYAAMLAMVTTPRVQGGRTDLANYTSIGYVPSESADTASALTLEYAYDDWAVGVMAAHMGDESNAALLLKRSQNYRNVYSAADNLMCPRSFSGSFQCPSPLMALAPYPLQTGYVEADAWQELWFVPQDPAGLIALFDSNQAFVDKLTTFVEDSFKWIFPHEEVPNALYWAGNEPSIFAVWLFNWADRADLAQNYSRALLSRRYTPTREVGLPGNDDFGTISGWATFAAMGLYPQAGNTTYALGSPVFPALTIQRAAQYGGPINIVATGASDANVYVQAASLGSQALSSPFIEHAQLGEATLTFTMGATPNRQAFKKRQ